VATISFSLPTANPDRSTENSPKWSARAIKAFGLGESEARKLKLAKTGTESLILGILVEGTSLAAKFLRENGVTIAKVQEEVVNLLGKSSICARTPERPPLSQQAQRALDWAVNEKLKSGEAGEVTTTHLLLGIWSEKESAGHKILSTLGVNDDKLKDLAKSGNIDYVFSFRRGLL
jgi:ATP-dependent Clp protease ATP-binding subunit ClpA